MPMKAQNFEEFEKGDVIFDINQPYSEKGCYATVYEGKLKKTGEAVALKKPRWGYADNSNDQVSLKDAKKEGAIWGKLSHDNLLRFMGLLQDGRNVFMISPFMKNGTVRMYLLANPDADRMKMVFGITQGLCYLHDQGVVHGDIKPTNILVADCGTIKICDFGLSRLVDGERSRSQHETVGGLCYLSPERLVANGPRTPASDVYAFAMAVFEIVTGQEPFKDRGYGVINKIQKGERPDLEPFSRDVSYKALWVLVQACWDGRPEKRPTMRQVSADLVQAYGDLNGNNVS